jgi:uncharacterized membrane protein YqgA involved in biofilm formation
MIGTIVNALAIIGGSLIGVLIKGGIPKRINDTVMKGMSLCVLLISILGITSVSSSLKHNDILIIIISIAVGAVIGEAIDIEKRLQNFGDMLELKLKGRGGKVSEGFVSASLVFCVGAMAIVGSLESGLSGNHNTLYAKSVIDGISSIVFASSLGIGVMLSGVSVFLYQGTITLSAGLLKGVLMTSKNDMTAIGSVLIIAIGLNMMGAVKIKVANLLPAIFLPVIYQMISKLF